ncbi:MAG: hypothetical protein C3F12_04600 [Candidatus Methylomirabilota bacterium]|nr:hypothetical protein [candidate division NC10 bacterium]PWB47260.1 MAG: hypothetical protein C3F12_04600 [candidate division NC10 bacterium]
MASGRLRRINRAAAFIAVLSLPLVGDITLPVSAPKASSGITYWQSRLDLVDGDLVFRTGRDIMARLVLSQSNTARFSHVGLIVTVDGKPFVVHALPADGRLQGGVILEPLAQFAAPENAATIAFFRVRNVENSSRHRIREYALKQLGKPFDDAFSLADHSRMYCTELALNALAAGGIATATVPRHRVMLLTEPVVLPDDLIFSLSVEPSAPNSTFARADVLPRPSGSVGRRGSM